MRTTWLMAAPYLVAAAAAIALLHQRLPGLLVAAIVVLLVLRAYRAMVGVSQEPRPRTYKATYSGVYPLLPREGRVDVWVQPEGMVLRFPTQRRTETVRHGLIESAHAGPAGRDGRAGQLSMRLLDRITGATYTASLLFPTLREAEDLLFELSRQRHVEADALWAVWRTVNLRLEVTDDELRRGFRKTVPFVRRIACPKCGGVEGVDPSCRTCAGRGAVTERDVVEVVAPPGTRVDRKFVFERAGNEDINGRRGPVVVRLSRREPVDLDPWPERDPQYQDL